MLSLKDRKQELSRVFKNIFGSNARQVEGHKIVRHDGFVMDNGDKVSPWISFGIHDDAILLYIDEDGDTWLTHSDGTIIAQVYDYHTFWNAWSEL